MNPRDLTPEEVLDLPGPKNLSKKKGKIQLEFDVICPSYEKMIREMYEEGMRFELRVPGLDGPLSRGVYLYINNDNWSSKND